MSTDKTSDSTEEADGVFDGYKFRVVLLGEAAVGKTSLLRRFTENVFEEEYKQTLGTTFATKDVKVLCEDGISRSVRLVIWDMGGQDTYKELRRRFMKGASGAVIVYDVTRPETFMAMNNWFESFRETCPAADVVICANKVDLEKERMVPVEPGHMLRDWFQADYFETSAKTGQYVTDVFARIAEIMLNKKLKEHSGPMM
ncbi:MAG: Rab family GTPase [Candidatus Thorarchaeota archaeon]